MKFADLWTPLYIPWENKFALLAIIVIEAIAPFSQAVVPSWFALPSLIIVFGTGAAYFLGEYNGASSTIRARKQLKLH